MSEAIGRARLRLEHVRVHIRDLAAELSEFTKSPPFEIRIDEDSQRGTQDVMLNPLRDVPETWSFIVGDIVHDLRATLDNVISDLGLTYGYDPKTRLAFPITPNIAAFNRALAGLMRFPSEIREEFRAVQPHDSSGRLIPFHLLWVLNELWNGDKHRAPLLTNVLLGDTAIQWRQWSIPIPLDVVGTEISTKRGEFKLVSIEALQYTDDSGQLVIDSHPEFQTHVGFGIGFGEMVPPSPATRLELWHVINKGHYLVEKMINRVEGILSSGI